MGIPLFFKTIAGDNNDALIDDIDNVSILYIDMNGLIHPCASEVIDEHYTYSKCDMYETKIMFTIENKLRELLELYKPKTLFMAIDGVAPFAKMKQQRERRYKSIMERNAIDSLKEEFNMPLSKEFWDKNCISPGTRFMNKLSIFLKKFMESIPNTQCFLSDSLEQSEGEHKILEHIRNHPETNGNILIHGLDADLIMLSLVSKQNNIYLYRENGDETIIFDIDRLKINILKDFEKNIGSIKESDYLNIIDDYVFICFFLGNDFLPHILGYDLRYGGYGVIMDCYKEALHLTNNFIVNRGESINTDVLRVFLGKMVGYEESLVQKLFNKRLKIRKHFKVRDAKNEYEKQIVLLRNKPTINNPDEDYVINPNNYVKSWKHRYYIKLIGETCQETIDSMCKDYFEGINWVFQYYFVGCKNYHYFYKFDGGPLMKDLYQYFNTNIKNINKECKNPVKKPIHHFTQLISILPYESREILPIELHHLFSTKPRTYCLQSMFKKYSYECVPILPKLDPIEIQQQIPKKYLK